MGMGRAGGRRGTGVGVRGRRPPAGRVLALAGALLLVGLAGGCAMPLPGPRLGLGGGLPPGLDREALLDTIASCHLLRVAQSEDTAVTDAVVIAAVGRYRFKVAEVIDRAELLVAAAADPRRQAGLRARADGACGRLATLTSVTPGLVRFDAAGNLGKTWVVVEGEITAGFAERTIEALRRERAIGLIIRSHGGSVQEARTLGRYLRQNGLRVAVDDLCTSACVDVLAGGSERVVTTDARLGIHQSRVPRQVSSHEGGQLSVATAALYLSEMGVDNTLALAAASVPHESVYWISVPEALSTRLATRVVPNL